MCFFVFIKQKGPDLNLDPLEKGGATRQLRCVIGCYKNDFSNPSVRKVRSISVGFSPYKPQRQKPIRHLVTYLNHERTVTVLSFFLDCRRNNQQTKTDRFTERSAIKNTQEHLVAVLPATRGKEKPHCMFRIFSSHTRAEKQKESWYQGEACSDGKT